MRVVFQFVRRVSLVAIAGLLLATPAAGQTGLATVTGLVSDSSGAAAPGVTVTATNQATKTKLVSDVLSDALTRVYKDPTICQTLNQR